MANKIKELAKYYATQLKFCVFPVHRIVDGSCTCSNSNCKNPGKHPRTQNGFKDATSDPIQIENWWSKWPNSNIGIATGSISNLLVLDIDPRNGGNESFEILTSEHKLPETLTVKSGGNGKHYYFAINNTSVPSKKDLGRGIDVKCEGGYIVAPPSTHISGNTYEWDNLESVGLAPIPTWLLEKFNNPIVENTSLANQSTIFKGKRNDTLFKIGCDLSRQGLDFQSTKSALENINQSSCIPPLEADEVHNIAKSVSKNFANKKAEPQSKTLGLRSLKEILAEPEPEQNWLVDGLLSYGGISIVVAKPKVGKSTLVRQLALSVANGHPFLGKNTTQGNVIYLSLEDRQTDVTRQFRAMGDYSGGEIHLSTTYLPPNMEEIDDAISSRKASLLIIDTMIKVTKASDLNDYAAVTKSLNHILQIAREKNCHICLLHHAKKGNAEGTDAILGSTAIHAVADTIILLDKKDEYRTIQVQQRSGDDWEKTILKFDPDTKLTSIDCPKQEYDFKKIEEEILDYLSSQIEWISLKDILENIEARKVTVTEAIRSLLTKHIIERSGEGKSGNPYKYKIPEMSGSPNPSVEEEFGNQTTVNSNDSEKMENSND